MAELSIPGVSQQIQLIARLRWMLFKNSLRNIKGRLEALSSAILWLMMSGLVLGGGIFFGIATYYLVQHNHWGWLAGLLWIVFVFWQVYPIFAASAGAQFDFANLLRFPLRFSSFFILSLVYGLFDPGAVSSIAWLFAMWIGLVLARPSLFLWGLVVLVAFGALNLFFSRMIFAWVEKWLARRRTREVLGFIFVLGILSIQLINPAIQHFHRSHTHLSGGWLMRLLPVANALPAGVAGTALQSALTGAFVPAAYSLLFVLLYAGVFLWLLRIRLAAQFHGENLSEARAPSVVAPVRGAPSARTRPAAVSSSRTGRSLQVPGLSRATSAIIEKELRYMVRNPIMLLNLVIPIFLVAVLVLTPRQSSHHPDFFQRVPQMIFPIVVAYVLLFQVNWVFNSFAFEGSGIQFLILAPVRFRDILVGKNIFIGMVSAFEAVLTLAAVSLIFVPPPLVIVAASFAGLLYGTLANFALGNILSVCYPRRLEFGAMRQKRQAGITVAVALVMQAVLIGIGVIVFTLAKHFNRPALAIVIFLILSVVTFTAYRISLSHIDRIALDHRETLSAELCRQE